MGSISRSLKWIFKRRLLWTLLWVVVAIAVAAGINVVGIHIVGNVDAWSRWLKNHGWYFLAWRASVYAITVYGWCWMRKRVLRREPSAETRVRLFRTEVAAVLTVLLLEGTVFLQSR